MAGRQKEEETLKERILRNDPYGGLQQIINFNEFGDTRRAANFVVVSRRQFIKAPE